MGEERKGAAQGQDIPHVDLLVGEALADDVHDHEGQGVADQQLLEEPRQELGR